jgi:hypothetical protein
LRDELAEEHHQLEGPFDRKREKRPDEVVMALDECDGRAIPEA